MAPKDKPYAGGEQAASPASPNYATSAALLLAHLMPCCRAALDSHGATIAQMGELLPATAAAIAQRMRQ
jgi:hypothetical protein